ncbi:MAG TPA: lysoplasmalogenase [Bryobacteraceae bacterium]|nr:lysoplasmalogenase [Bryobacteraceae bacterium]
MPNKTLRLLSIFFGILYLITQPWQPYPGSFIVKGLSVGLLAAIAFPRFPILGFALAVSTLGDVLLDLDPQGLFVYGLGSFLIAHIAYVVLFVQRPFSVKPVKIAAAIGVLLYSIAISAWLFPSLGDLKIPVAVYMCAITTMAITAILASFPTPWVAIGAILFVASDSLLAINKFKTPIPYRDILVWSTYYAAQFTISTSVAPRS